MQNVTEYYAGNDVQLFITVAYLLSFTLLSWMFASSYMALRAAKQALQRLQKAA